jgi:hypothetical protein
MINTQKTITELKQYLLDSFKYVSYSIERDNQMAELQRTGLPLGMAAIALAASNIDKETPRVTKLASIALSIYYGMQHAMTPIPLGATVLQPIENKNHRPFKVK